jgi:hypothetical protein
MAGSNQDGTTIEEYRAEHAPPSWAEVFGSRQDHLPDPFVPRTQTGRPAKGSSAAKMARQVAKAEAAREAERERLAKTQRREARRRARERAKYTGMSSAEVHAARANHWGEQTDA